MLVLLVNVYTNTKHDICQARTDDLVWDTVLQPINRVVSRAYLKHLEFYIINSCNLSCDNCRSFSNFRFNGLHEFDPDRMQAWADRLDIGDIEILGGEPTLHPRLHEWIRGLRQLWPSAHVRLVTNGVRLTAVENLHQLLVENRCNLMVSMHGYDLRPQIAREIFDCFGECEVLPEEPWRDKTVDPRSNITRTYVPQHHQVTNSQIEPCVWLRTQLGVIINVQNNHAFQDTCFTDDAFALHNSDPGRAHDHCGISWCHHFIGDRIYKCSILGLLPEFLRQQKLATDHVMAYQGLALEQLDQDSINQLREPTPHCRVCPENNTFKQTTVVAKGSGINKKIEILASKTSA